LNAFRRIWRKTAKNARFAWKTLIEFCPVADPQTQRRYVAFISYRHSDNQQDGRRWAGWLHHALETYAVPRDLIGKINGRGDKIPATLYPIFRDEEELPADADLSANIRRALERSENLIVICSPRACQSRFVAEEIRYFKELGKSDRILALIIDGEPNADDPGKVTLGITPEMECLPYPLRWGVARNGRETDWEQRSEPLAADVRPCGRPEEGYTNATAYRLSLSSQGQYTAARSTTLVKEYAERLEVARLKVLAGLIGVPLGTLRERDAAYRLKRFRRMALILGSFLSIAIFAALFAFWQRHQAESARLAQSVQLEEAARSDQARAQELFATGQWREAVAHLGRALRNNPAETASAASLWQAITYGWGDREALPEWSSPVPLLGNRFVFSPDGKFILIERRDNHVRLINAETGGFVGPDLQGRLLTYCTFSADSSRFAVLSDDAVLDVLDIRNDRSSSIRFVPESKINSAAFLPDNTTLLISTDRGPVRKWDLHTGRVIGPVFADQDPKATIVLSPDGHTLAATNAVNFRSSGITQTSEMIGFWNAKTGEAIAVAEGSLPNSAIVFSSDGRRLLMQNKWRPQVIEVPSGRVVGGPWDMLGPDHCIAISPDGRFVAVGTEDGDVFVHGVALGKVDRTFKQGALIQKVIFTHDSRALLIASQDGTATLWDFLRHEPVTERFIHSSAVIDADIAPGDRLIVTGGMNEALRLWSVGSHPQTGIAIDLPMPSEGLSIGATLDNSEMMLRSKTQLKLWDSDATPSVRVLLEAKTRDLAVWSRDKRYCFTASFGTGEGELWDVRKLSAIPIRHAGKLLAAPASKDNRYVSVSQLTAAALSLDATVIATGGGDGVVRFWNVPSGSAGWSSLTFGKPVKALAWNSDGGYLATVAGWTPSGNIGDSDEVSVRNPRTGGIFGVPFQPGPRVLGAIFSPDNVLLATYANQGPFCLWEVNTGKARGAPISDGNASPLCSFSPDGKRFATLNRLTGNAQLWDTGSGRTTGLPLRTVHAFSDLDWSPDGRWIATATWDEGGHHIGRLQIWEAATGRPVGPALEHGGQLKNVRWIADGQELSTIEGSRRTVEDDDIMHRYAWRAPGVPGPWIQDLVTAATGVRFSAQETIERIPIEERAAASERLRALRAGGQGSVVTDPQWATLLKGWLTPARQRESIRIEEYEPPRSNQVPISSAQKSGWLIPDSSVRRLTIEELKGFTKEMLWRARNEVYARNGLIFSTDRGRELAKSLGSAYHGTDADQERVHARMNEIERANVSLLTKLENERL
jgi:WD40 repeat protein